MIFEFLIAIVIIELTPGPNMVWLALLAVLRGSKISFIAVAGIMLGLIIAATASVFGITALIKEKPLAFELLRIAGFLYLLYLAWDAFKVSDKIQKKQSDYPQSRYFIHALLNNILNPKAYLVYTTILPQFTDLTEPLLPQLVTLSTVFILIATSIHVAIVLFAGRFHSFFIDTGRINILGQIFSVLLVLVAFWFLYMTQTS
jgi:threonine/homoserine/homoserine lactone efflux protein